MNTKTYSVTAAAKITKLSKGLIRRHCQSGLIGLKVPMPYGAEGQHYWVLSELDLQVLHGRKKIWDKIQKKKKSKY